MITEFVLPHLSETSASAKVIEWFVETGNPVHKGERLVAVETDKAVVEIESPADGFLRQVFFQPGSEVQVEAVLALLSADLVEPVPTIDPFHRLGAREAPPAARAEKGPEPGTPQPGRLLASPVAVRLAQEMGVDLQGIVGTGPGGRITRDDVVRAAEAKAPEPSLAPISSMRRAIAEHMARSKQAVPHAYSIIEVDMSEVVTLRDRLLAGTDGKRPIECSYTDILIKAVALSIRDFPRINSSWQEKGIRTAEGIHIGIAVSLGEEGLLVPVIRNADDKSIGEIASETKELIHRAKERRLAASEFSGGTFTITNLGMYGLDNFVAIINQPESCILAVGAIKKKPAVVGDEIVIRPLMQMTLSVDHRVIDGAYSAQFLQRLRQILSQPGEMLEGASKRRE